MFTSINVTLVLLQNMEKDKALERRFQQVYVKQPNVEDTVSTRGEVCFADHSE